MKNLDPERYVEVSWRVKDEWRHTVRIKISLYDETGILNDISNVFAEKNINISEMATQSIGDGSKMNIFLSVEVRDIEELRSIIRCLGQIKNVVSISRLSNTGIKY